MRVTIAKSRINSMWALFIKNNNVQIQSKMELFNDVVRSLVCYGSQYWGYQEMDGVEVFLRDYIKRALGLPKTTPTYALKTELGMSRIFEYTLKCNMYYIYKVLNSYEDSRFPKIFAKIGIEIELDWVKKWYEFGRLSGINLNLSDPSSLKQDISIILKYKENEFLHECIEKSRMTQTHGMYHELNYFNGGGLLKVNLPEFIKTWIIRVRLGMIGLNNVSWRQETVRRCSICNLNKIEDIIAD